MYYAVIPLHTNYLHKFQNIDASKSLRASLKSEFQCVKMAFFMCRIPINIIT